MPALKTRLILSAGWLFAISAFGDFSESGVFDLNTQSPPAVTGSVFTADTTQFETTQLSEVFLCSTIHFDQKVSEVFICNLLRHINGSGLFIADTMAVPVDTDGDGLPNIWEMRYFGGTTAGVPSGHDDQDGANNFSEYIAGTNPKDSESLFVVEILNGTCISWPTILNRIYTVQHCSTLAESFTNVTAQTELPGTGEEMTVPCPAESSPRGFYRVNVQLP